MRVSVICTCFNKGAWIAQALDGILAQECPFDYEVIVVDDASSDDSPQIIRAYEDNGTTYNKPHRALATAKKVLGVGFDQVGDFDQLDIWYDKDSRKVKIEGMGNGDAKLLDPSLFVAAY